MDKPRALFHSTRRPGQPGTKALLRQHGERLVCVRYYYDEAKGRRLKTVELVIEDAPWQARPARRGAHRLVGLRVGYQEKDLQSRIRQGGGKWDRARRLWLIPLSRARVLRLANRIEELT